MKNSRLLWHWLSVSLVSLMLLATNVSAQSTWDAIKDRGSIRVGFTEAPSWFSAFSGITGAE